MSKLINGVKETIMRCDLLACAPTMRVKGQPAYESVLGGFLSLAIMSCFIAIFSASFIQVLNRVDISASMTQSDNTESTNDVTDLQFAVGIQGVQLGGTARYFDIYLEQVSISGNSGSRPVKTQTQVILEPAMSKTGRMLFKVFQMSRMLCIRNGMNISLKGYEGSPDYSYLTLKIKTCTNNSYQTHACKTPPQIASFISNHVNINDFFKVKFLIVDTRISPSQQNPVSKILEKKIFLSFTDELGTKGYISFAHYSVTTDTSIMPYTNQNEITASFIHKNSTNTIGLSSDKFIYLEFFKATQQLTVTRSVVKVDEMLSYVGGLFGLLWVVVAFFLASFNQYRYELYASEAAFTFDQTGRKIKQKDFGFFTYIGYSIYDWLNTFGCAPKCWTKMRQINETRQEICQQLDVAYLFRKIRSLQKTTACLLNQNKRICAMLTRQPTLQETQQERKLLELYSKLNPSPSHTYSKKPSNKVDNIQAQNSGQNFVLRDNIIKEEEIQSEVQKMQCDSNLDLDQDQQYEEMMNIIKDAYSSIEAENDEICKRIKQKIPQSIKRAMQKKQFTRKIIVQDVAKRKFQSCQNSFIDPKYK